MRVGGYRFDSGLHYTVPWSTPVFALTCLLQPADVTPFTLMGEEDGTVDNIYLHLNNTSSSSLPLSEKNNCVSDLHFKMLLHEKYLPGIRYDIPLYTYIY